ncbi:helix-turn-helix domain-containing protein [uncultured Finegoldia sp.]|uniref:helix-turn-helix domain-containing protein n=1 Tax=uncultured Finegoldia sp. TaxID=328009 RepID=UPI00262612DD|nr:helix-turn-helix transcriptional regulator [uncultured Finegoldia sp.]
MSFGSKIKKLREDRAMTQTELAEKLGVTLKTISNYETKNTRPRTQDMYKKIADFFNVDINFLLTVEDSFVLNSRDKFGYSGKKDAEKLIDNLSGLFAGGSLPEEDKDKLFNAIAESYYQAKLENKKYGKRKNKKDR